MTTPEVQPRNGRQGYGKGSWSISMRRRAVRDDRRLGASPDASKSGSEGRPPEHLSSANRGAARDITGAPPPSDFPDSRGADLFQSAFPDVGKGQLPPRGVARHLEFRRFLGWQWLRFCFDATARSAN
jgi:hypothetical protein